MDGLYSALVINTDDEIRDQIATTLARFPKRLLEFVAAAGCRIQALKPGEKYLDASLELRTLQIDVDAWPAPPAGLFVVAERRVYVRSLGSMTVAHEFSHAIDCALGGGVYWSSANLRSEFAKAKGWVTPYAATGLDEYFAEAARAFSECNDPTSPWPRATRARLQRVDPALYRVIAGLWDRFNTGDQTDLFAG